MHEAARDRALARRQRLGIAPRSPFEQMMGAGAEPGEAGRIALGLAGLNQEGRQFDRRLGHEADMLERRHQFEGGEGEAERALRAEIAGGGQEIDRERILSGERIAGAESYGRRMDRWEETRDAVAAQYMEMTPDATPEEARAVGERFAGPRPNYGGSPMAYSAAGEGGQPAPPPMQAEAGPAAEMVRAMREAIGGDPANADPGDIWNLIARFDDNMTPEDMRPILLGTSEKPGLLSRQQLLEALEGNRPGRFFDFGSPERGYWAARALGMVRSPEMESEEQSAARTARKMLGIPEPEPADYWGPLSFLIPRLRHHGTRRLIPASPRR